MGQVKRSEVAEADLMGDVRKSVDETTESFEKMNAEARETAEIFSKDLNAALVKDTQSLNKFMKAVKEMTKLKQKAVQIENQQATQIKQKNALQIQTQKIAQEKLKTEREEIRNSSLLARQKAQQARAEERAAKAARDESDAYKRLSKRTREQKNESKRLAAQMIELANSGKRNTKEYRELASQYRNVTKEAKAGDVALKKIDQTVGDNFRNVGNYAGAVDGLKRSFVRIAGALGLFQAVKGVTKIVANFDQAQGDLQAISGKTEKQLEGLTAQAKQLGATTQFSATEITNMQIELAKLGFSTKQITQSTSAVANFAAATGADIPAAAQLAGASLRGFGLDASEMERVVSTLGVATTKTALDFNSLQSGISTIAPVANAFGFSIEDSTALLGQLANAGFDASSAATATRNILLNLADANGDLAQELGRPITSAEDLAGALQELEGRGIDLGEALNLTDKRSVAAFQTFLKGSDSLVDLKKSITGANDELEAMAAKKLDTISGQFTLLGSAWEGFILNLNEGVGAGEFVKNFIGFLAGNLPEVIGWIAKLGAVFLIYKARLIAVNVAQKAFGDGSGKMVFSLKSLRNNLSSSTGGLKNFSKGLKNIGWTAAIALAVELASAFYEMASGALTAKRAADELNKSLKEAGEIASKAIQRSNKDLQKEIALIEKRAVTENLSAEEVARLKKRATQLHKIALKEKANEFRVEKELLEIRATAAKQDFENYKQTLTLGVPSGQAQTEQYIKLENAYVSLIKQAGGYSESIRQLNEAADDLSLGIINLDTEVSSASKSASDLSGKSKKVNTEFKTQIDLVEELNNQYQDLLSLQKQLSDISRADQIAAINEELEAEKKLQLERAKTEGGFDFSKIEENITNRKDLELEAIEATRDFELETVQKTFDKRFEDQRKALEKEKQQLIEAAEGNATAIAKIEENFAAEMEKIDGIELDAQQNLEAEKLIIKANANSEIIELERNTANEITEINKELVEGVVEFSDKRQEEQKADLKKVEDAEKEAAKRRKDLAKALSDFLIEQSNKRISQLEKELQANLDQADFLKQAAAEGNISAKESIAEQQRLAAENEQKIAEIEKRKQTIELISSAYQTYQTKQEQGSESPLQDTIAEITLLQAFIQGLSAFKDGTEDTGPGGGLDAHGGFLAMLHPREGVIEADTNKKKLEAGLTNKQAIDYAVSYQDLMNSTKFPTLSSIMNPGGEELGGAIDELGAKLDAVNDTIKNRPQNGTKLGRLLRDSFEIIDETKSKGIKTKTTYLIDRGK